MQSIFITNKDSKSITGSVTTLSFAYDLNRLNSQTAQIVLDVSNNLSSETTALAPFGISSKVFEEVQEVWRERIEINHESKPVSYQTYSNALDFLKAIFLHTELEPEVSSFPDGELVFDWETKLGKISVMIDDKSIFYFSKTRNDRRRKGSDAWSGTIPNEILEIIANLSTSHEQLK